jgi:hypothetical protein
MVQLHKRFTDSQVRDLIEHYLREEIERDYIQAVPGVGKTRFFSLIHAYRQDSHEFSIQYPRKTKPEQSPRLLKTTYSESSRPKRI